ncbi:MAG: hypothetical protein HKL96_11485 [Phycisphaerales bacterium]|nr:hypothetical protein [Phycisphaerales bacterium]
MPEEAIKLDAISAKSEPGKKTLKFGFNGFMVMCQLVLAAVVVMGIVADSRSGNSVAEIEIETAAAAAAVVLAVTLPFATLAALLGLRKRCGAGRPADQPPKIITFDMLSLIICLLLLLTPGVMIVVAIIRG